MTPRPPDHGGLKLLALIGAIFVLFWVLGVVFPPTGGGYDRDYEVITSIHGTRYMER